uniref:RNA pseudouridylate synthase domain-containing protein 2 n=1 Tax=Aceria tosichella TaxID=561515 RepID=A0A6G1SLN8_9ACAR
MLKLIYWSNKISSVFRYPLLSNWLANKSAKLSNHKPVPGMDQTVSVKREHVESVKGEQDESVKGKHVESAKREHDESTIDDTEREQGKRSKCIKVDIDPVKEPDLYHAKDRLIPKHLYDKLSESDIELLRNVNTSCLDLDRIKAAIQLRLKYRLSMRLPEDMNDSTYYIENGLRKVYPYPYLYQTYTKRRWIGRKLKDVLKEEFRDISDEQLKMRFDYNRILINGNPVGYDYILRDNNFISNRNHRHELPVLATPIKKIFEDKDTLVIDKPPSVPIHPCGRFRHNSVVSILSKEYNYNSLKVVHRLDRLVSGVLIMARNLTRAHTLEDMIRQREVLKEYVCRVAGEFPLGDPANDGFITVDQPLEHVWGKIGLSVITPNGKQSVTKFKRLNYNGKTSCVLCQPLTGRMHQIRVHLQYLGHPIVNDGLYNSDAFGPERGKGARYGKTLKQLSDDVVARHRATSWLISDGDMVGPDEIIEQGVKVEPDAEENNYKTDFLSEEEREETTIAIKHFFTEESWKDLEQKWRYDPNKFTNDPTCRDCVDKFHDPPLRKLFLYLHAFRYSGTGWSYQSEMPVWARDTWTF